MGDVGVLKKEDDLDWEAAADRDEEREKKERRNGSRAWDN
jgi:hypothetical protein